jgi:hypothetical protein
MVTIGLIWLGFAIAANLPRIIWAFRCPADSPNYKCPSVLPLRRLR